MKKKLGKIKSDTVQRVFIENNTKNVYKRLLQLCNVCLGNES